MSIGSNISYQHLRDTYAEIRHLDSLIIATEKPSVQNQLRSVILKMVDFKLGDTGKSVEQLFLEQGLRLSYLDVTDHSDFWNWWTNARKVHACSTIRNQARNCGKIISLFKSISTKQSDTHHRNWNEILEFYRRLQNRYNMDYMKQRRARANPSQQRRRGFFLEKEELIRVGAVASATLDEIEAVRPRRIAKRRNRKTAAPSLSLSVKQAKDYSQALLWKLTMALGTPRTNEVFMQWQLGNSLCLETRDCTPLDWKDFSLHADNYWRFFKQHIKCPDQIGRSDDLYTPVTIPRTFNPRITFYLKHVRPLFCKPDCCQDSIDGYFFLNPNGKKLSGHQRLVQTRAYIKSVTGKKLTIRELRRCVGHHLQADDTLTADQRSAAILMMGHTEETHNLYYVYKPTVQDLDPDTIVDAFQCY